MLLVITERQKRLKFLDLYNGKIDGVEGKKTKQAYLDLQKKYFVRKKDIDGKYGKNTEILLMNAYNVKLICKNFKLEEFRCHCNGKYCTGYPAKLDTIFLANLQLFRIELKKPINITSGLRCKNWNKKFSNSTKSRHLSGKAVDFYTSGTSKLAYRKELTDKWVSEFVESRYSYSNGYANNRGKISHPTSTTMGHAIHIDVL